MPATKETAGVVGVVECFGVLCVPLWWSILYVLVRKHALKLCRLWSKLENLLAEM